MREYRGEKALQKKLLIICTVMSKAARFESTTEHAQFTENIVEGIMLLLKCDLVERKSASMLLTEILRVSPLYLDSMNLFHNFSTCSLPYP